MYPSVVLATLFLSASFVGAQCPGEYNLVPQNGKCVCEQGNQTVPYESSRCTVTLSANGTACHKICPSHAHSHRALASSHSVKRPQLILNEDGSIANCPEKMISCPIDPNMNMGYECISPREDLGNCGGCVALGQGVSCEKVAGVKDTECNQRRCVNYSCHSGWVLDSSNNCVEMVTN